jgi:hypothetical protein
MHMLPPPVDELDPPAPVEIKASTFRTLMRPRGNWICSCGCGNFPTASDCIHCTQPREVLLAD